MIEIISIVVLGFVFAILSNNTIDQTPKKRVYSPPSPYCPSCATKFSWKDMIPFWSYIRNRGKCPYCQAPLPKRRILIDIFELSWVAIYVWKFGLNYEGSMALLYGMSLIGIIILSKEKRELSDGLLMIMGMLAIIHFLAYNPDHFPEAALGMIIGAAALVLYNLIKIFAADGSQFEMTEIKLGALLGLFLGLQLGFIALSLALIAGAVLGSINMTLFSRSKDKVLPQFTELLAGSGLAVILWGQDILKLYHHFI